MERPPIDHIEDRIRQASENISPPFNDKAWEKMEELLDRELGKKRRRRFLLWWPLLVLLLSGSAGLFYYAGKDPVKKNFRYKPDQLSGRTSEHPSKDIGTDLKTSSYAGSKKAGGVSGKEGDEINSIQTRKDAIFLKKQPAEAGNTQAIHSTEKRKSVRSAVNKESSLKSVPAHVKSGKRKGNKIHDGIIEGRKLSDQYVAQNPFGDEPVIPEITIMLPDSPATSLQSLKAGSTPDSISAQSPESTKRISQKSYLSKLYFLVSVARDQSTIEKLAVNKNLSTVVGVGAGYRIKDRLSVQTGFYSGRKIYQAGPGDYKARPGSYWDTVNMIRINANCLVFDIPLSVRYEMLQSKNLNFYTVAGLSSFLMKSETYDYHYRYYYNGAYRRAQRTYTGNKHFLSVANLSIGMEHKLPGGFYLQAEPYVKIPLTGVGEGKVNLYSAGLQIGLKYQPLTKSRKH